MSREKQIEEMAEIICQNTECDTTWNEVYDSANALYNAGYRKASDVEDWKEIAEGYQKMFEDSYEEHQSVLAKAKTDVAREIFEELDKLIIRRMRADIPLIDDRLVTDISELKKKYTEGEE